MAAADGRQLLDAAEHIGQMAQRIFYALRRGVGCAGERAERGDIGEAAAVEAAEVQCVRLALDDVARGLQQVARQVHAAGKVVRAACGDIADGRVASGRIDLRCVAAGSCSIDCDVVAAAVENADDLRQRAVRTLFSRAGVQNE